MSKLIAYTCPNCGGSVAFNNKEQQIKCLYCDTLLSTEVQQSKDKVMKEPAEVKCEAQPREDQGKNEQEDLITFTVATYQAAAPTAIYEGSHAPIPKFFSFDFSGRLGRLSYINTTLIIMIAVYLFLVILSEFFAFVNADMHDGAVLLGIITLVLFSFIMLFLTRNTILRLHDLDSSGWLALILVLSMAGCILIMAIPGTKGRNKYGVPVVKGHIAGLIVFLLLISVVIALAIFID